MNDLPDTTSDERSVGGYQPTKGSTPMSQGTNSSKVAAAMFALTAALAAGLAGVFLLIQSVFPWMTVLNPREDGAASVGTGAAADVADVTNAGPTPAEVTLKKVMGIDVPELGRRDWSEIRASDGVPGVSFGFGCDPTDGLAPVVAEGRSWVQTRSNGATSLTTAVGTLDVSARAYPAGGGAVAFTGLTEAVVRCSAASSYATSGVGVEVVQVVTSTSASVVWRRGDVIMVGTVTASGRPGSVATNMDVFQRFDAALKEALSSTCMNQSADEEDAKRSPYVNRTDYVGNTELVKVKRRNDPTAVTAEDRTFDPVVPIPGPHVEVPYVSYVPAPPVPAVTDGPSVMPTPVPFPTEPVAPTVQPTNASDVAKRIDDPVGPGCGWDFTGQVAPNFDADAARTDFTSAVRAAKRAMAASWERWQEAKFAYYGDYAEYVTAARKYERYAAKVAEVTAAWAVVENARADYYSAVAAYDSAVSARELWETTREQAVEDYKAAKKECRNRPEPEPTPEPDPSASPSASPTTDPEPEAPEMVCPPVRPTILDEEPPVVPASPVPAVEAQLPLPQGTEGPRP